MKFVVMPDHFHALLTVGRETTVERAAQLIKGGFAFRAGKELGFKAPVWRRGFSENRVQDAEAFENLATYIRDNPVRRHLIANADEFSYSPAYQGFNLDPAPQGLKPTSERSAASGMAKAMP